MGIVIVDVTPIKLTIPQSERFVKTLIGLLVLSTGIRAKILGLSQPFQGTLTNHVHLVVCSGLDYVCYLSGELQRLLAASQGGL